MEPRISLITLGVADLDRAVRFYRDGLGFPTTVKQNPGVAFFLTGGTRVALYPFESLANDLGVPAARCGSPGITLAHNTRTKNEVAQILAQAVAAGATEVKPPHDTFWGGHVAYFTDPDGHYWEIAWAPMFTFAADGALILEP